MDVLFNWIEQYQDNLIHIGVNLGLAIIIFIVGRIVAGWIASGIESLMKKKQMDQAVASFIRNLSYAVLMTLVLIVAVSQLGVNTNSLVAVVGAAGLAIGLALQGSLSNFASGVLIVVFRPFKAGDYIEAGGTSGLVSALHIFSTTLITPDNKQVIVPNSAITGGAITNYSAMDKRRVDLVIGVSYDADLKQARRILESVLAEETRLLAEPAPTIGLLALADSSVNFAVRPWVKTADYWDVFFALQEAIKLALDEAEIGIPYPQMDIHISKEEAC